MAPPPVTPSPHRFVIKRPAQVRKTPSVQEQTLLPSNQQPEQQFKATPRFNFSSNPKPTSAQSVPASTPSAARFTTPARQIPQHEDVIENVESSFQGQLQDSIETEEHDIELGDLSGDDEYEIGGRSTKRRRVSSSLELHDAKEPTPEDNEYQDSPPDSSLPILSSPPAARRPVSSTAPRFLISTPAPSSAPQVAQNTQTAFFKPPRFRPPDPAEQPHMDPLPDQFSPHRRGQKYLAGGLAAGLRDWLVNLEPAISANSAQRTKYDPWFVKILVDEISCGGRVGMTLIRGMQLHSTGVQGMTDTVDVVKVILAGEGAWNDLQKGNKVEVGNTVGIKGPVWEVVLMGEKWGVGVDWKVLF